MSIFIDAKPGELYGRECERDREREENNTMNVITKGSD